MKTSVIDRKANVGIIVAVLGLVAGCALGFPLPGLVVGLVAGIWLG